MKAQQYWRMKPMPVRPCVTSLGEKSLTVTECQIISCVNCQNVNPSQGNNNTLSCLEWRLPVKKLVEQKIVLLCQLCRLSSLLVSQEPEDGCKPFMNNCMHSPNSIINQANPKKLHQKDLVSWTGFQREQQKQYLLSHKWYQLRKCRKDIFGFILTGWHLITNVCCP